MELGGGPTHRTGKRRREALVASQAEFVICDGTIEGGLHQRRDVTLREDRSQVRQGHAPQALACLNNVVVGLAAQVGEANLRAAQRGFTYRFDRALQRWYMQQQAV
jgi:hypothetical protein